jgi:hypothetical protein
MRHLLLSTILAGASLQAADTFASWFEAGSVNGNLKYYYIQTDKENPGVDTSAHANSIGGKLHYETGELEGFKAGTTFMTTNGFALPDRVDTSILGRDNGVRLENSAAGSEAQHSFAVLGEGYLKYTDSGLELSYGRRVVKTPLVHAKEVRMLPSAVQGSFASYTTDYGATYGLSYLTHFKQRTSDAFTDIVRHALGDRVTEITGSEAGGVAVACGRYAGSGLELSLYDYYAADFLNAFYAEAAFKNTLNGGLAYRVSLQGISESSVGNADDNLAEAGSVTGGEAIRANAVALKADLAYGESKVSLAVSKVFSDDGSHDSLVLPWDGTPLYTNMITSNNLFQSNYGKGLGADSVYIGGSLGVKAAYSQGYGFAGLKGLKTTLSYLVIDNDDFADRQHDFNAVVAYSVDNFSLALKGMWVRHNSGADAAGTVSQLDRLTQYRVIADYTF